MNKLDKLKMLLENVSDSYPDFVSTGLQEAKNDEKYMDMLISFIEAHPHALTSEIIKFETEEILHIKPISD